MMSGSAYSRKKTVAGTLVAILAVGAAVWVGWLYVSRSHDNPLSEDAVLTANIVNIASAVAGRIATIDVVENQKVTKGDLLFTIDPEPYRLAVMQARADLRLAEATLATQKRNIAAEESNAAIAAAQVTRAETNLALAEATLARLTPLLPKGYVTAQQVDDARTARDDARTSLEQAIQQSLAADALVSDVEASEALVEARRAALAIAERSLANTEVRAPADGRIVGLTNAPGEFVIPGQSLFTLIDTTAWYASATFSETDIPAIKVGDCASVYALADRSKILKGKVEGIGWGVVSEDIVNLPRGLPYVPKSLNWVRIAQRFPVRIHIQDPPDDLMRIGASAVAIVHRGKSC